VFWTLLASISNRVFIVYFGDRQSLEHSKIIRGGSNSEIPKFVRYSRPSQGISILSNTLSVIPFQLDDARSLDFVFSGTSSYIFDMLTKVS
jgi:hypothetical protein